MNYFSIIIIILCFLNSSSAYLQNSQMSSIRGILINPVSSPEIKHKTRECLAYNFIPFALAELKLFTRRNTKYMKNIKYNDLRQYAIMGLCDAAKSYNGSYGFCNYARKYIIGSLHEGLTVLEPLKPQSKLQRLNGIHKPIITWGNTNEEWVYSLENDHVKEHYNLQIEKIKQAVDQLDAFDKRLFYYKYCSETLKEIRSNRRVSDLTVISVETYRQKMSDIMSKLRDNI